MRKACNHIRTKQKLEKTQCLQQQLQIFLVTWGWVYGEMTQLQIFICYSLFACFIQQTGVIFCLDQNHLCSFWRRGNYYNCSGNNYFMVIVTNTIGIWSKTRLVKTFKTALRWVLELVYDIFFLRSPKTKLACIGRVWLKVYI